MGPKGAVGRVGPLPEDVAAAEARRRAREDAVAAKREKKYRLSTEGGSEGGSETRRSRRSEALRLAREGGEKSRADRRADEAADGGPNGRDEYGREYRAP